jgi:YD repeat-containing protein
LVKYPVVSGAATNSQFTVNYSGGSSTQTVDQSQNNSNGWVAIGKYAFTQSGTGQQVSLAESSAGTVVTGAVKIVRDNSGTANTAVHGYTYSYDANGQQTGIADSSPGAAVANYVTAYDQDGRTTSVTEDNSSGTAVHTTTYGYDADGNQTAMTHDKVPSTYEYNNVDQQSQQSDAKSSTDTSPQVSTFTYTPAGQVLNAVKPNGNTVANTYYANELPSTVTEKTSGGTLVSSHQYSYNPNGDTTQNVEQLMSADSSSSYLNHTTPSPTRTRRWARSRRCPPTARSPSPTPTTRTAT